MAMCRAALAAMLSCQGLMSRSCSDLRQGTPCRNESFTGIAIQSILNYRTTALFGMYINLLSCLSLWVRPLAMPVGEHKFSNR